MIDLIGTACSLTDRVLGNRVLAAEGSLDQHTKVTCNQSAEYSPKVAEIPTSEKGIRLVIVDRYRLFLSLASSRAAQCDLSYGNRGNMIARFASVTGNSIVHAL